MRRVSAFSLCLLLMSLLTGCTSAEQDAQTELTAARTSEERFYALPEAAKQSVLAGDVRQAEVHARELLTLAGQFPQNWNYGNAIHDGNMVLGQVALKRGDVAAAKDYLLRAGRTPGSPQLDSFGPNMSLAQDLLQIGEREVVLEYFDLCAAFWEMERGRLAQWRKDVRAQRVPEFGANLVY